ncbi:MAG: DUF4367 domain-containing protein [Oscillospiraceae bacterium]|nr:DUF4367 domain-containing protein [Oscillospiraceae bacterium]
MADRKEYNAYGFLEELPLERLEELLAAASAGEEDEAYLDAVISAILKKEETSLPDIDQAWADFQQYRTESGDTPLFPADESAAGKTVSQRTVRFQKLIRIGLAAALAAISILGTMAAAQAAGLDVFGAMARWTDNVFSFGEIRSDGAADVPSEFTSLQEALDAYGITEVSEPWIPNGYTLDSIETLCMPDGTLWHLSAEYTNGIAPLHMVIDSYWDEPISQIEKTDAPVETFVVNDTIVYLLENIHDNSAAWATEHYECFVGGAVEKSELRQMVLSIYENGWSESGAAFTSLQEALDAYGITEVSEPAWIPEGYTFRSVMADCWPDGEIICLAAEYSDGTNILVFEIERYKDKPSLQVEKTSASVETFAVNSSTAYLLENINNNMAAWATEHYACYISGIIEKSKLRQIVLSTYGNYQ